MVLDLSAVGFGSVLSNLIPKPDTDPRRHRLAELEAMIVSREEQMQAVWNRWLNPDANISHTMRERAEQQLQRIDADVVANKAELAALRQELRVIAAHDDDRFDERVREAKEQLASAQGEARYAIRLRLAQELRRRIDRIVLYDDRTIRVRIREHQGLAMVDVRFTADGIQAIDVIDRDGSVLTSYDRAGMVLLEPIETQAA
jgi:hypothetical protein